MRILGITAEYNPFHNGHRYHLEKSKEAAGADYTVAVMSGNFTQRGEPAALDKWTRSRLAAENGVDLVLELPFVFACGRAERFARGAIDILAGIGATHISFGSESGDLDGLQALTKELREHEEQLAEKRSIFMKQGNSFVKSNQLAAEEILGKERTRLMHEPNNILALEYLRRISYHKEKGKRIEAVTVKRHGSGYSDANESAGFAGASYIRRLTAKDDVSRYVPGNVADAITENMYGKKGGVRAELRCGMYKRFFDMVRSEIVRSGLEELSEIHCMGEGLENKFKKEIVQAATLDELISSMVSRRYTEAAIRRLLVYILLGVKERELPPAHYGRVLAAGIKGRQLLKLIKNQELSSIPIITNINKEAELHEGIGSALHYDILASDMYNLLWERDLYAFSDKVVMPYMEQKNGKVLETK